MSLAGKTAVITGSTSGIGLAIARSLASRGVHIMFNGLNSQEEGDRIASEVANEFGVKTRFSPANMRHAEEVRGLVDEAVQHLGGVDILCNNAGVQYTCPTDEFPPEKWDDIIAINLSAPFHAIQAALPHMKKKNWGRIVNTASVHGLVASVNKTPYCAAKHGLVGMTKVVALETAETGITCNAFCPGWVNTPLIQAQIKAVADDQNLSMEEAGRELVGAKQPSKTFIQPEQIGELVAFLCSDAAEQITGVSIPVDGGWNAQ